MLEHASRLIEEWEEANGEHSTGGGGHGGGHGGHGSGHGGHGGGNGFISQMAQIKFGLGVARLVHNQDRSEDKLIEQLLRESLTLRTEIQDHAGRAETLNSIGSLFEKKTRYKDAEEHYKRSLDLRERHLTQTDPQLAQSYVSLGNLYERMQVRA